MIAPRDPGEGIEHLEEIDEGGNEKTLGGAHAGELGHQRDLDTAVALGARNELAEIVRSMADVGISQQEIVGGVARGRGLANPLFQRPQLARPARRQRRSGKHVEASLSFDGFGNGGRAVTAAIVDQHDPQRPGIVLGEQAADGSRDHVGLVAGGNDRHDGRPA